MESLVKVLLRVPGLSPKSVAAGLRAPPFEVFSVEEELQAQTVKSAIEKFGAVCEIENTALPKASYEPSIGRIPTIKAEKDKKQIWKFCLATFLILVFFAVIESFLNKDFVQTTTKPAAQKPVVVTRQASAPEKPENKPENNSAPKALTKAATKPPEEYNKKNKNELKGDLSKNPYNTGAWKALYEKLESEGDSVSASKAKDSYDKALRAQMVLASLAKTFGDGTRVEIAEDAVYYRISKDLSDSEFYHEAEKLRESLNATFPGKSMVLENYKPDNKIQSIRLGAVYKDVGGTN